MKNSIFSAVIRSTRTFVITVIDKKTEEPKDVLCSIAVLRMSDGSISKVFAYGMDLTKGFSLADVTRIPIGQPLYEDGPLSEPGKDLVFEGAMTLAHATSAVDAIEVATKLDL